MQPHMKALPKPAQRWQRLAPTQCLHVTVPVKGLPPLLPIFWHLSLRPHEFMVVQTLATPQRSEPSSALSPASRRGAAPDCEHKTQELPAKFPGHAQGPPRELPPPGDAECASRLRGPVN